MIHSRLNNLGLGFQFSPSDRDGLPSVVPDPFAVHLPNCTTYGGKSRSASDRASIRTLLFREVEQGSISSKVDLLPSSRLAKLFILDENLAIQEHLFTTPLDEQRYREMNEVSLPRDALRLRRRNRGPRSKKAEFVVDDLDESTNIGAIIRPKIPQLRQELPLSAYFWTVDFTSIYAAVVGERIPYIRRQDPIGSRRFQECLGDLTDLVMSSGNEELTTAQTMYGDCGPLLFSFVPMLTLDLLGSRLPTTLLLLMTSKKVWKTCSVLPRLSLHHLMELGCLQCATCL